MSDAVLQPLFEGGRLWRGQGNALPRSALPSGFAALDAMLPGGGWPMAALSEILLPADGVGELHTLWPLLARLSAQGGRIVLVAPPYIPFAPAWAAAGIALPQLQIVQTDDDRNAMWVAEQCLRSAACAAVVCWPRQGDPRTLRRLQLAAETGQCQGFAMRPAGAAVQPSMAALRILVEVDPPQWRVLKCRGGNPPARAVEMFQRGVPWRMGKPSPSVPLPSEEGRSAAQRMLSPPSVERAARRAERAALARSAEGMLSRTAADIADQKPYSSVELPARSLRAEGGRLAQGGIEPSPQNGFIVWGRGQGEGGKPLVREAPRSCVVHASSPQPSPPSKANGGEGEKPPCASVLPLQTFPPLKADGEEGNRCFTARAS